MNFIDTKEYSLTSYQENLMTLNRFINESSICKYILKIKDEEERKDLLTKTVKIVEKIGYEGAVTLEFIYEQGGVAVCDSYHIQTEPKITLYYEDEA